MVFSGARLVAFVTCLLITAMTPLCCAQTTVTKSAVNVALELPDAPGMVGRAHALGAKTPAIAQSSGTPVAQASRQRTRPAGRFDTNITPDEIAPPLSVSDKVLVGLKDSVSPLSAISWLTSAGWSHLIDGRPNYGVDSGAFGERLGASVLRDTSETIFTESVFAPVFHEDPRYYQMGRGHSILRRGLYAATRVVVTRKDDGRATPNLSLFAGDAAGAALTLTYYPSKNTSFREGMETFTGSLGGSAIGFVVDEFLDDALRIAHLKKRE